MDNKISACLVVYNEENNIRRCLDSIKEVVDEIIVVHDGKCEDETLEICRKYTDKIFIRDHVGEAEPHRPFSFRQALGDWIMQIDADEFLSDELKSQIKILAGQNDIDGYSFRWRSIDLEKNAYISSVKIYKPILFRKNQLFHLGIPHYNLKSRGRTANIDLILNHKFIKALSKNYLMKINRWAKIHALYLMKDFSEIDVFQATKEDWEEAFKNTKKYGYLMLIPFIFLKKFAERLLILKVNAVSAFYDALYISLLVYYYRKIKITHGL